MIRRFPLWWRERSPRERWLVGIAAVLVAAMLLWLLVIRPTHDIRDAARARQDRAAATLGETIAAAAAVKVVDARPRGGADEPLVDAVRRSATAAGFTIARLEAEGDGALMSIAAARPPAVLGWLGRMEGAKGIFVRRFTARRNQDATIAVDVTLARAAR